MAGAGLGDDLLLANEVTDASRLGALDRSGARITVAVDSEATIDAAARGGVTEVLIDVNVGTPPLRVYARGRRSAGRARPGGRARRARRDGLRGAHRRARGSGDAGRDDRGIDGATRARAHEGVGGDVVSGGGTGTYDMNGWVTEIQAGSYALMDTAYAKLGLPFAHALECAVHRHLGVEGLGGGRLRAEGPGHGSRQSVGRGVGWCGSAPTSTSRWRQARRCGSASASGCCRPISTRRSRITNTCTSSTATKSSSAGTSICGDGDRVARPSRRLVGEVAHRCASVARAARCRRALHRWSQSTVSAAGRRRRTGRVGAEDVEPDLRVGRDRVARGERARRQATSGTSRWRQCKLLRALVLQAVDPSLDPVEQLLVTLLHAREPFDDEAELETRDGGHNHLERELVLIEAVVAQGLPEMVLEDATEPRGALRRYAAGAQACSSP